MTRFALALLLGIASCPATEPTSGGGDAQLEFRAEPVRPGSAPATPGVQAQGGEGRITVRGLLDTPDPCQKVSGELDEEGGALTLRVATVRVAEMCVGMIGSFQYDAVVSGLEPGTYRLRVVHTFPGTGWETQTALDQSVAVR